MSEKCRHILLKIRKPYGLTRRPSVIEFDGPTTHPKNLGRSVGEVRKLLKGLARFSLLFSGPLGSKVRGDVLPRTPVSGTGAVFVDGTVVRTSL